VNGWQLSLAVFVAALAAAAILGGVVRGVAPRLGLVDRPRGDRWHRHAVPRAGGVALYLTVTAGLLLVASRSHVVPAGLPPLLAGGTAIFLVGLLDDLVRLENRPKLVLLVACAVVPVALGVRFATLSAAWGAVVAFLWILGATNAFNWLDNMDGVAGGVGLIAAGNLALVAVSTGRLDVALPAVLVAGACGGFLVHNFPPARLFLGDSGSGFLGLTLATLAVVGPGRDVSNVLLAVLPPTLILAVPLFDTALVTVQRVLYGRSLFRGGTDHPAHRLVALGLSERQVVLLLYMLSAAAGVAPWVATSTMGPLGTAATAVVLAVGFGALGVVLAEARVYEGSPAPRGATLLPAPFLHKRWLGLMGLDIVMVTVSFVAAHLLRFEGQLTPLVVNALAQGLPLVVVVKTATLYLVGLYRGVWRYAGVLEVVSLAKAAGAGSAAAALGLLLMMRLQNISRAALVIDALLSFVLLAGVRFSTRLVRDYVNARRATGRRVLLFGAGASGTMLLGLLRQNPNMGYRPVGFIDDDPLKQGLAINGLRVMGDRRTLAEVVRHRMVEEVLLADPSCPDPVIRDLSAMCRQLGVPVRRLSVTLEETPTPAG
jgi:UDP-GlcNAc:undecaprenyl-phosphate/decaprenyl-phosphate GlcNAc-1-phosphate transferase